MTDRHKLVIKNCPFCGEQAAIVQIEENGESNGWVKSGWTVNCYDETCIGGNILSTWSTEDAAARAW